MCIKSLRRNRDLVIESDCAMEAQGHQSFQGIRARVTHVGIGAGMHYCYAII